MKLKPVVLDVVEDDGRWLDTATMTYYEKDELEPFEEMEEVDTAAVASAKEKYPYEGGTKGIICSSSIPIYVEGFKDGAKWRSELGVTVKGEIMQNYYGKYQLTASGKVSDKFFKFGDKVYLQVLKRNK